MTKSQEPQKETPSARPNNRSARTGRSNGSRQTAPRTPQDSWGGVADWYKDVVESDQSHQKQVILPSLLRRMGKLGGKKVLDVACGTGFFSHALAGQGAKVTGIDIGKDLIAAAQQKATGHNVPTFIEQSATDLGGLGVFDHVLCVLALQNMGKADEAIGAMISALAPGGTLYLVINHPSFRIPKHSRWEQQSTAKEGKRVERIEDIYMSEEAQAMMMHPGSGPASAQTMSYHRPLQWFFKHITNRGGVVTRLEEWISEKESQEGPWKAAEDAARKEFPLFMYLEVKKI